MTCPKECDEDRKNMRKDIVKLFTMSIPTWVRALLIGGVIALFGMYATAWAYNVSEYATKAELRELKAEGRITQKETREMFKEIINRLPAKSGK